LARGFDPNELDNDFWTPLHYCAFYNRLDACQALLLNPRTDVNVPNRTGATPLHFAALNGHVYVAELILSHQFADVVSLSRKLGKQKATANARGIWQDIFGYLPWKCPHLF
jgi:ankyrin repeat protein